MFKKLIAMGIAAAASVALPAGALACGGLVAPNGAIRLSRASTLVDWRGGVEHYLTSFSYQGTGFTDFGWLVPLPAVPDRVEEGGGWTLQRLFRETHPVPEFFAADAGGARAAASSAEVLQQVQVRALDITVLRGTGAGIVQWCLANHFLLTPETRAHLEVYAKGSPIFMAAKYNVARAQSTGQLAGDGAPVLVTMHTQRLWVPLEVLANGTDRVGADVYLLTDRQVFTSDLASVVSESPTGQLVGNAAGLAVRYQETISSGLYRDLSSDKNMGWVKPNSWLTYLTLDAPAPTVTYDLGVSQSGVIHLAAYGTHPAQVADGHHDLGLVTAPSPDPATGITRGLPAGWLTILAALLLALALGAIPVLARTRPRRAGSRRA